MNDLTLSSGPTNIIAINVTPAFFKRSLFYNKHLCACEVIENNSNEPLYTLTFYL